MNDRFVRAERLLHPNSRRPRAHHDDSAIESYISKALQLALHGLRRRGEELSIEMRLISQGVWPHAWQKVVQPLLTKDQLGKAVEAATGLISAMEAVFLDPSQDLTPLRTLIEDAITRSLIDE